VSWIQKLQETYDRCAGQPRFAPDPEEQTRGLMPVDHAEQQVHIEITLGGSGKFRSATLISKKTTFIPATEESAGRTSAPVPHGLADKLEYIAPNVEISTHQNEAEVTDVGVSTPAARKLDASKQKESPHTLYLNQLRRWVASEPDPHVEAVLGYVEGGTILKDLLEQKILHANASDHLLTQWTGTGNPPPIFKVLTATAGQRNQLAAVVRWRVELRNPQGDARLWLNPGVQQSWQRFVEKQANKVGLCMVTGEQLPLAFNHPKRIRHGADGAKLISTNDKTGFNFRYRGRFVVSEHAYGIGSSTTQKAHSALRWLIERQGYRNGDQAIVAWAVSGNPIPKVIADSHEIEQNFRTEISPDPVDQPRLSIAPERYKGDAGQLFANQLNNLIRGYAAKLAKREDIVVMALDSATTGRMAITYYRELQASEFLDRIKSWHEYTSWPQNLGKGRRFVGAPSPKDIAEAAYGRRAVYEKGKKPSKLLKATIQRLLPCIIDGRDIPLDLIQSCVRRAASRVGLARSKDGSESEFEFCLGIACSLLRQSRPEEQYDMALDEERKTRSYLYGRLLAVAENIERFALDAAGETRDTSAGRYMQRFADHPFDTWLLIAKNLKPYETRLRSKPATVGFLESRQRQLAQIGDLFDTNDFIKQGRLDGEFLLGYYCQRQRLHTKTSKPDQSERQVIVEEEGESE
jgi:CRISPR-associated protein Csd1